MSVVSATRATRTVPPLTRSAACDPRGAIAVSWRTLNSFHEMGAPTLARLTTAVADTECGHNSDTPLMALVTATTPPARAIKSFHPRTPPLYQWTSVSAVAGARAAPGLWLSRLRRFDLGTSRHPYRNHYTLIGRDGTTRG